MDDEMRVKKEFPWDHIQGWLDKRFGASRRLSLPVIVAIGIGLVLIVMGSFTRVSPEPDKSVGQKRNERALNRDETLWTETQWERELAATLSKIRGAGQVWVDLTVEGTEVHVWQEKEENQVRQTQEGTGRSERETSTQRDLVLTQASGGSESPVLKQLRRPHVIGVVVIAEGADNPSIQEEIWRATLVATGADPHRVVVIPGETSVKGEN